MPHFNLISHPWIPVRWHPSASGEKPALVSLHNAFTRSRDIADLDAAPHERIALTRLLVCIAHAALGAPESPDDWQDFGHDLESAAIAYLARPDIHPHFNLLGDGPRFLQPDKSKAVAAKPQPMSKVFFSLASGNGSTLLDHHGENDRPWSAASIALGILCLQNFFIGGSMGPAIKGNGPALKFLHLFVAGHNLKSRILNNCLDLESIGETGASLGLPIWENDPDHNLLPRLAPLTCSLWVTDDLASIYMTKGYEYPAFEAYRDPYATTILSNDDNRHLIRANPSKALWRDLHLLICIRDSRRQGASLNLKSFIARHQQDESLDLWVGEPMKGRDAKGKDKATIDDLIESSFTISSNLFSPAGRHRYEGGINHADEISKLLRTAVWAYFQNVTSPDKKGKVPGREIAEQHYWHRLDQQHQILIDLAANPVLGTPAIGTPDAKDPWTLAVRQAAVSAYQSVCPRTTPRQIEAFALGYRSLHRALHPQPAKISVKQPATA